MSIEAIAWAYTIDATPQERNVLFGLALCANGGHEARPGVPNLCDICRMEERAVQRALNGLVSRKVIERVEQGYKGHASTYKLMVSNLTPITVYGVKNDIPLIDRLINLLINGMSKMTPYPDKPVKNDAIDTTPEPTDEFTAMCDLVTEMTGYPIPNNQAEIEAIKELVKVSATREDFTAALAFLKGKKVARGACDLLPSIRYNLAKRTQGKNAKGKMAEKNVHTGDL